MVRPGQENAAANLGPFCVYLLLLPTVCLLLRGLDVDAALRWRSAFTWGFVLLAWIGGAAAWAMPKIPALLLMVLLCSLLLCGCGGQPLSKREIVRAVFFAQQGEHYSVCLLLADQNAPEGESAFKTASAAAPTPAQALENAAATLPGTVYYGLLDAAALPVGADWEQAQEIGLLLYDHVPACTGTFGLSSGQRRPRLAAGCPRLI